MNRFNIAVLIPVHNALSYFQDMIDSLYEYTDNFKLFICDDASDRSTKEYIKKLRPHKLLQHRRQSWFTRSANDLLLAAYLDKELDYFFLLNTDITLCENWAETLIDHFDKDEKILLTGSDYSPPAKNTYVKSPEYLTMHAVCFKRYCITRVGLLDEKYFHISSDREYSYKVMRFGYKVFKDTQLPIIHSSVGPSWNRNLSKLLGADRRLPPPRPTDIKYYL